MMWLGTGYEQGWFGMADYQEALKWTRRAAKRGDPDAQNGLGQMYENGEGVPQNYAQAAKWYRKAAEHVPDLGGAGQGRNNLGMLYLSGQGVSKDLVLAVANEEINLLRLGIATINVRTVVLNWITWTTESQKFAASEACRAFHNCRKPKQRVRALARVLSTTRVTEELALRCPGVLRSWLLRT
jgi:tetratricopeptide (TPR) repeat protein